MEKPAKTARWAKCLAISVLVGLGIGILTIAVASFFRNAAYAGFETDPGRWPRTSAFVERSLAHPCFADLLRFEDVQRSAEIKGRRQALLDGGAPLTSESLGVREPRRGMMRL